jgi:eukaryotic-like serine/threonine-protein kinase
MPLVCPQGHSLERREKGHEQPADDSPTCPVCGDRCLPADAATIMRDALAPSRVAIAAAAAQPSMPLTCSLPGGDFPRPPLEGFLKGATLPVVVSPADESLRDLATVPGYQVLQELGRGGMGVVYLARQQSLNRLVALKMILSGARAGSAERLRFRNEAEAIGRLQHPNVVQVHEAGECAGWPYLSMEYCAGGSLAKKLDGTPLPPRQSAVSTLTLARAVQVAHEKGIIHRDLKPANVLLGEDGTLKLTDFGLAKKLDAEGPTITGAFLGTPSYMPPEQARGKGEPVGPAADVYSLGAILYEMMTGRPPFRAATTWETVQQLVSAPPVAVRHLQPGVPRDLETICLKCLEKSPARRYGSARELTEDLERFLEGKPILARPAGRLERGWRWCKRNPALAWMAGAAAVFLLSGTAAATVFAFRAERNAEQARTALAQATLAGRREREARLEAEENGQRAGARFKQARAAVDQFYTQVSESPELKGHDLEDLRRSLLESAATFYENFAREGDNDPDVRAERGRAFRRLGSIDGELGRRERAEASFRAALTIQQRLVGERPGEPTYRFDLLKTYNEQAAYFWNTGNWGSRLCTPALEAANQALPLGRELVRSYPGMPEYRYELATTLNTLGTLNTPREEVWNEALNIAKDLVDGQPAELRYRLLLALMYNQLGYLGSNAGRTDEAEALLDKGIGVARQLLRDDPGNPEVQETLASLLANLGTLCSKTGRPDHAIAAKREYAAMARLQANAHPSVVARQFWLVRALGVLAMAYEQLGKKDLALPLRQEIVNHIESLAREHPDDIRIPGNLAAAQFRYGAALCAENRTAEGMAYLESSRKEEEQLSRMAPIDPDRLDELYRAFLDLASAFKSADPARADAANRRAEQFRSAADARREDVSRAATILVDVTLKVEAADKLARDCPSLPDRRVELAQALHEKGVLQLRAMRLSEAEGTLRWELGARESAGRWVIKPTPLLQDQANARIALGFVLAARGRHEAAAAEAATALELRHGSGETFYDAARVIARSAASARTDPRLTADERKTASDRYCTRAMELLTNAETAGFFRQHGNTELLKRNEDLNAVCDREDFKQLCERVEQPAKAGAR